jgi:hypothetical protein
MINIVDHISLGTIAELYDRLLEQKVYEHKVLHLEPCHF